MARPLLSLVMAGILDATGTTTGPTAPLRREAPASGGRPSEYLSTYSRLGRPQKFLERLFGRKHSPRRVAARH